MDWGSLYGENNKPSFDDIEAYINSELWKELNSYIQKTYNLQPQLGYSCCSMQKGWNVKYKKSSKSLCTLYPMNGYFIALVVIGAKEKFEADMLINICSEYTKDLYNQTEFSKGGKWMMINVTNTDVLLDIENLIKLRVKPIIK